MEERKKLIPRAKHRYWNQNMKPEEWGQTEVIVSNRSDIYNRIATDTSEIDTPSYLSIRKNMGTLGWNNSSVAMTGLTQEIFGNIKTDNILDVWQSKALRNYKTIYCKETGDIVRPVVCATEEWMIEINKD